MRPRAPTYSGPETREVSKTFYFLLKGAITREQFDSRLKLLRFKRDQLRGAFSDWVRFCDLFKSVMQDRADIVSVEKFTYLKATLQGKALAFIASVAFGDTHYYSAWKELFEHYANPGILGFDYVDKM
ncbi:hypothetical protein J437_LFUL000983 [Ladona fulva]|uniref:Uncharacterized protein n=1 Tax=Ladona fulva TaxID=123851 RepID=A0A8K0P584_LADFU|nr:hypothetical protein J437_LFUL000983 [Ladona fulva]